MPRLHRSSSSFPGKTAVDLPPAAVDHDLPFINAVTDSQAELRCRDLDNCRKVVIAALKNRHFVNALRAALLLHHLAKMILRIVEEADGEQIVLRLIGRIESEQVRDLKAQLANETRAIVLDLSDITLVNQAAVRFLRLSEDKGIELRNCPAYVREWIRGDRRSGDESE